MSLLALAPPVARRALAIGLHGLDPGAHVFVTADPDVRIEDDVVAFARRQLRDEPERGAIADILYVHDFARPEAPRPLLVPAGAGPAFADAMGEVVETLRTRMVEVASAEPVKRAQARLGKELEARQRMVMAELESFAKRLGFGVREISGGVQTYPILRGKPLTSEQYEALDEPTRKALSNAERELTRQVEKAAMTVRSETANAHSERDAAFAEAASALVDGVLAPVVENFAGLSDEMAAYLHDVREAFVEDWRDLAMDDAHDGEAAKELSGEHGRDVDPEHATRLARFKVNVLVAREPGSLRPVVYERNPTYPNLFGYLERRARFGALLTDFTRIRAGALHRASGGVLVLRAADVVEDSIIWERLKRVLRESRIGAEDPIGPLGLYATTLRPDPVPIDLRVILVGPPGLYAAMREVDADFGSLFRVKVEIEPTVDRTDANLRSLDAHLMDVLRERHDVAFDTSARARLLALASRLAGDRSKLSLMTTPVEDVASLATVVARERIVDAGGDINAAVTVTAADIARAWDERREGAASAERHLRELTVRGDVQVDTAGSRVGVVNGLSVYSTGDYEFGQPVRITGVVSLGRDGIIDVEREAQLGGSIHTKGMAILRGYLGCLFGQERPISLRAQIAFEQSYGEIDGDSASAAELFVLLSALSEIPIDQGIAVTGSMNQLGDIQAVGGICAKIEGFYDLCMKRGLTGSQGVMMPKANLPHLLLRDDVVKAIEDGAFHLYAIGSAADGIRVLTGVPAGERDHNGRFPAHSVFGRVELRLIELAERLRESEGGGHHDGAESHDDASVRELEGGGDYTWIER